MNVQFRPFNLRIDSGRWDGLQIISNSQPVFSWAVQATANGQYQSACRIQVETEGRMVWDSDWISQKEQRIVYGGEPLSSSTLYTLTLTVQNNEGDYSQPVQREFATALLEHWPAPWIMPEEDFGDSVIYATKQFSLQCKPKSGILYACGIGYQLPCVNGKLLSEDQRLSPAVSSYHKRCYYIAYRDLQDLLQVGENALGMMVAPGWRRNEGPYMALDTRGRRLNFMGRPQFTAILELRYEDGTTQRIMTDDSWKASYGAITSTNIFMGEVFDARKEAPNWCLPKTEVEGIPCQMTDPPGPDTIMCLQELEHIQVGRTYMPRSVTSSKDGVYIFDFGQNLAGICQIKLPRWMEEGTTITLRHAELLDEYGMLYTAPLRSAAATDTYIAGDIQTRKDSWTPIFTYHGFRYVEVSGLTWVPEEDFICAHAIYTAVDNRSTFRCGSAFVNQLHDAVVATERANIHSIPTDCPQRDERLFWLNDATIRFEEMPFNFDTGRLFPKIVKDIMDAQREDGAIPCTAPFVFGTQPTDPVCSSYLVAVKQAYLHHGNVELVQQMYPALRAWNECIYNLAQDNIISYTLYGDWASPKDCCTEEGRVSAVTPGAVLSTGFCYYNTQLLAWFADILGMSEEAQMHRSRGEVIKKAMLEKWLREDGTFASGSQACQAFVLCLDILPEEMKPLIAAKLHEAVEAAGNQLTTGNVCAFFAMKALMENGGLEDAWMLLHREEYPSLGYMLQNDATTIWERFELKKEPEMNSHSHPMYGAVDGLFYSHIAGIQPVAPGFRKVRIQPHIPENLTFAEATLDTCMGDFYVKWRKQYGKLTLQAVIPFGAEADIHIQGDKHHVKSGTYCFIYDEDGADL